MLLGAVGLLLGDRGSAELIRTGADELRVTGRFELVRPEQRIAVEAVLETTLDEPELILTRRLSRAGRSTAYANDLPVTVAKLKQLGELLVDVHGQRESYSLLQPAYQLDVLDLYGKLADKLKDYETVSGRMRALRIRHRALWNDQETRRRELKLLRFEREELEATKLKPKERDTLELERNRLANAQSLSEYTSRVAAELNENEGSVLEIVGRLIRKGSTGRDSIRSWPMLRIGLPH